MKFTEELFNQTARVLVDDPCEAGLETGDIVKVYVENEDYSYVYCEDEPSHPWMINTDQIEIIESEAK